MNVDTYKTKEQLSNDVKLIKDILDITSSDFGKSYRIFFVVAAFFVSYIAGCCLFDVYAITTFSESLVAEHRVYTFINISTVILFFYPIIIFAVMYFMKRRTVVGINVAANKLINLWGLGIGLLLITPVILGYRNNYAAQNLQGTDSFINSTSASFFVSATVFVLLYYATAIIIQDNKVFKILCIVNIAVHMVCCIIFPIVVAEVSKVTFSQLSLAVLQGQIPNLIAVANLIFMGYILRKRFKEGGK